MTLDECHPEARLMPPAGSPERAQALRWLLFVATELYPIVEINDYPRRFAAGATGDPAAVRELARGIWRQRWQLVEEHIAGEPYLLPTGFCLTDVYIAVVSRWTGQGDWRRSHLPRIEALTRTIAARRACAPVWERHFPSRGRP